MMWQVMLYATGVAAALSLMGYCEERLVLLRDLPRRWVWPLTMVLSIAWVPVAMYLAGPATVAPPELELVITPAVQLDVVPAETPAIPARPAPAPVEAVTGDSWTPPSDRTLLTVWAATSALLLLSFFLANTLLRKRSARWRRARVLGREVMVSQSIGPALMGAWQPRMVVPEWFMAEAPEKQELILQHEEQHIAASDPLLLRAATLFALALPWNLPLWWQLMRMRQAIELDCDARVLRNGASPAEYGSVLLAVTRRCARVPAGLIAMSEPVSALERRIRHLVPDASRRSIWRASAALLLWMVGVGAAVGLEAPPLPQREQREVPRLLPPPRDSEGQRMPMQALVEQHPELFSGAQPEGVAFVTMELRPDGSVAESRLRHVPESEAPAVITATSKEMKKNFGLWILKSGTTIADATTRGPVNLFVTWQEPVPDEARFSKADVAAALERHLPDAVNRRGTSPRGTPWLVLSREGNVMRSGYIRLRNNAFDLNAFNSQVRDLTLCAYQIVQDVGTPGSGERARSVILAWVQDGAGARQVAAMSAMPTASPAPRQGGADLPRLLPPRIVAPPERRRILERAIVDRHPELVTGPERDGQAFVSMRTRPDGSVESSEMKFVERGDTVGMMAARSAALADYLYPERGQLLLVTGWQIAGEARLKSNVHLSYGPHAVVRASNDESRPAPTLPADVAQVLEHYLPGALDKNAADMHLNPYLVLSADGKVLHSGYFSAPVTSTKRFAELLEVTSGRPVTSTSIINGAQPRSSVTLLWVKQ